MKINLLPKRNYVFLFFGMIILLLLIELSIGMKVSLIKLLSELNTPDFLKNNLSIAIALYTLAPANICRPVPGTA